MADVIKRIDYFYTTVDDKQGKGYWLMELLRQKAVNLIAFTAFPLGGGRSQIDFIPEDSNALVNTFKAAGVTLTGPKRAFLIRGDDEVGALAGLFQKLTSIGVNIHAANGVCNGDGNFGFVLWVKSDDYEAAANALGA